MSDEPMPNVRIYYLPQSFPCGPSSACCGPVGQSLEELAGYVAALTSSVPGIEPQLIDASAKLNLGRDLRAIKLLNAFGAAASPIFTVGQDVVSMGPPAMGELVGLVAAKLESLRANPTIPSSR